MKIITSLSILLFFVACKPKTTDPTATVVELQDSTNTFYTQPYYFPVETLKEGKVYEYSLLKDSAAFVMYYWHLQTQEAANGQTYLIWKRYNPFFEQDQYIKEWIVRDGVIVTTYEMLIEDKETQATKRYVNEVEENIVFPFHAALDTNMAYRFSCTLTLPPDFVTVRLVRDRQFSQPLVFPYKGKKIPAVAFACTDLYDLEDKQEGGFWEQKTASVEIYAKGIGLVYTEEKKGGEAPEITQLTQIYSLQEFEALKAQPNPVEEAQ